MLVVLKDWYSFLNMIIVLVYVLNKWEKLNW